MYWTDSNKPSKSQALNGNLILTSEILMSVYLVPPVITLHPNLVVTNEMGNAVLFCNATSIVP